MREDASYFHDCILLQYKFLKEQSEMMTYHEYYIKNLVLLFTKNKDILRLTFRIR